MTAQAVFAALKARHLVLATAESCTGGMLAAAMTDIAGSSEVFDRGFVTYSNAAKRDMLGIGKQALENFGAVSKEVARAMALGAIAKSNADVSVAITGIAGPSGGTPEKPVGLVHFAVATKSGGVVQSRQVFPNDGRDAIRKAALNHSLQLLLQVIEKTSL